MRPSRRAAAGSSAAGTHGEPLALALDYVKLAVAELGSIGERRTALLVDPRLNGGLPPFLATSPGVESGMMIYQYTAAALVSEHKVLAHPASATRSRPRPTRRGSRLDGLHLGSSCEDRARGRPAGRGDRALVAARPGSTSGRAERGSDGDDGGGAAVHPRRVPGSRRPTTGSARGSPGSTGIGSPVRTSPRPTSWSGTARWSIWSRTSSPSADRSGQRQRYGSPRRQGGVDRDAPSACPAGRGAR